MASKKQSNQKKPQNYSPKIAIVLVALIFVTILITIGYITYSYKNNPDLYSSSNSSGNKTSKESKIITGENSELMEKMKRTLQDEKKRLESIPKEEEIRLNIKELDLISEAKDYENEKKAQEKEEEKQIEIAKTAKEDLKIKKDLQEAQKETQKDTIKDKDKDSDKLKDKIKKDKNEDKYGYKQANAGDDKIIETSKTDKIKKTPPRGVAPKLAIIIDDIGHMGDAKELKSLPYKITPSIFPVSQNYPDTKKISQIFDFYMIHIPMEANSNLRQEKDTLKTTYTKEDIEKVILNIKRDFPKAKYLNNHTGSKFTSHLNSMDKFFSVIVHQNLEFIDSKTTPNSKADEVAKKYNKELLSRDVFLDNELEVSYIKNQLKRAVENAKKYGYAIAIGHPHKKTFEALRNSKDILKEVEIVYVKNL